jgi:hypothetical protein
MAAEEQVPANAAALELGIARDTLVRRIQQGAVKGRRLDGRYFVARAEIDRLLSARPAQTA